VPGFVRRPLLLRGIDAVARRYGRQPAEVLGYPEGLDLVARDWYTLILSWATTAAADKQLRHFLLAANNRGELVVPTLPVTSWPR
jgi:hypothetical protein